MLSSGTTAIATTTNAGVAIFGAQTGTLKDYLVVINEGAVAGFVSIYADGSNKIRLPAGPCSIHLVLPHSVPQANVKLYRVEDGTDVASVYAYGF
jgi:hypothetical protein